MRDELGDMAHSFAKLAIHLVFATRDRARVLGAGIRPALHGYMATVLRKLRGSVVAINSVEDHVHTLFELGRTLALSSVVEHVKRTSSRWIKTQSGELVRFAWQNGYGAFAVSESNLAAVRRYIERPLSIICDGRLRTNTVRFCSGMALRMTRRTFGAEGAIGTPLQGLRFLMW